MNPKTMTYPELEPQAVFRWFAEISRIPRESNHETEIAQFLEDFAQKRGLEVRQDAAHNIYIRKPATPGREHLPPLILQGHMDMVCVRGPESQHDFRRDPIEWVVRGDALYANQTTLGADNGIAVAYALALLDSSDLPHPPLEVLITAAEETGMDGAMAVDGSWFKGRALLNIDSEEQGVFLASCAGGANLRLTRFCLSQPATGLAYQLRIEGLLSGHSGMEIVKQRANAISLLGRVLYAWQSQLEAPFYLSALHGGTKHNAIAASAYAVVLFKDAAQVQQAETILTALTEDFKREFSVTDPGIQLQLTATQQPHEMFVEEDTRELIGLLYGLPHGVISIEPAMPGLVRTSLNLGILSEMAGIVELTLSVRSSLASEKHHLLTRLQNLAKRYGAQAEVRSDYPAWEYREHSPLREQVCATYERLTGQAPEISAIHAGLECGLLSLALPDCDMLSLGPNLYDVHTAKEHLSIESVAFTWTLLKQILADYQG